MTSTSSSVSSAIPLSTQTTASGFPRSQNPMITLLQKRRDGSISKGAIYMLGLTSYEGSRNRKNLAGSNSTTDSITKVDHRDKAEKSVSEHVRHFTDVCSSKLIESAKPAVYEFQSDTVLRAHRSPSKQQHQPSKIEDYEPGRCSLAVGNGVESRFYNPPIEKPGQKSQYTEGRAQFDQHIHKLGPMSPTQSKHELYRSIQKGGNVPEHGLQLSAASDRKDRLMRPLTVQTQHMAPLPEGSLSPRTRQQRDIDNALRHMRLERVVAEEKIKRLAAQNRDNESRRHSDFYTPLHKAPVSLNRYDDESGTDGCLYSHPRHYKSPSKVRGKARALYHFRAQTKRELSFRKGEYLYLLRQVDKNWFLGERHGLVGIFPVSYVEVIVSLEEAHGLAAEREGIGRVLYDFVAHSSLELSLHKGDVVRLVRAVDENWYEGHCGGRRGIFPASYVETLVAPDCSVMTPMTSRSVTPMPGWTGPLSPCGSTISCSAAPTIPSAPLSPADSEFFDESRLFLHDISERSDVSTPVPSSADADVCNFADRVKSMASSYQFEGRRAYQVTDGSSKNVTGNFIGSATWSPQSTLVNPAGGGTALVKGSSYSSYSHLRYPPYRVQYSYKPRNPDELELHAGDVVYVVETCADGWFIGTCERTQEFGTFPGNYVQRMR